MRSFLPPALSKRLVTLWLCILMASAVAWPAPLGQSGRRSQQRANERSTPTASDEAKPTTASPANKDESTRLTLFVVNQFASDLIPPARALTVFNSFIERLRETSALTVKVGDSMSRKEARERAKAEKAAYLVWLQLQPDTPDVGDPHVGAVNFDDLVINYVVFTPTSAEVKLEGRVYYQRLDRRSTGMGSGNGRAGRSQPSPPRRIPAEPTLERAGREAANRIIDGFKELLPPSQ